MIAWTGAPTSKVLLSPPYAVADHDQSPGILLPGTPNPVLQATLAGFAPGIAVSYPLTRGNPPGFADHYLDVPWTLVLGLSVLVPLVAALGAALLTRSRLPLAARVET